MLLKQIIREVPSGGYEIVEYLPPKSSNAGTHVRGPGSLSLPGADNLAMMISCLSSL